MPDGFDIGFDPTTTDPSGGLGGGFGGGGGGGGFDPTNIINLPDVGGFDVNLPNLTLPATPLGAPGMGAGSDVSGGGPGGGGGLAGWLKQFGRDTGGVLDAIAPAVKLGTGLGGIYSGIRGMQYAGQQQDLLKKAQQMTQQAAAPGTAAAGQLIPAGTQAMMGGALPGPLEAIVQGWEAQMRARLNQYYSSLGIPASDIAARVEGQLQNEALQMRATLAGTLLQSGQSAGGAGVQGAALLGQLAQGQSQTIAQAIQRANEAIMQSLGRTG